MRFISLLATSLFLCRLTLGDHAVAVPGNDRPAPHDPDLPTFVYLSNVFHDGWATSTYEKVFQEGLESCRYPNRVALDVSGSTEVLDRVLKSSGHVPQGRDNYLFFINAHGWIENEKFMIGNAKTKWYGDEVLKKIADAFPPGNGKRTAVWFETCHAGALATAIAGVNVGGASGKNQYAYAGNAMGMLSARVACAAARGDCAYFHGPGGFDADGDGVLQGRELQRLLHARLKEPVTVDKSCSAGVSAASPVPLRAQFERAVKSLEACGRENRALCERLGGVPREEPAESSVQFDVAGTLRDPKTGREETFRGVPLVFQGPGDDVAAIRAYLTPALTDPLAFARLHVTTEQVLRHGKLFRTDGPPPPGAQLALTGTTPARTTIRKPGSCRFPTGAVIAAGGNTDGVQIAELRNFALDFPRCARRRPQRE